MPDELPRMGALQCQCVTLTLVPREAAGTAPQLRGKPTADAGLVARTEASRKGSLMRSKFFLLMVACVLVGMAAPAMGAQEPEGVRISILGGTPAEYAADEPFFILHGWGNAPSLDHPAGLWEFTLEVNGEDQGKGKRITTGLAGGEARPWLSLYTFEEGMPAGVVTFTGYWWAPCELAVEYELWFDTCPTPNAQVPALVIDHTATFVD